MAAANPDSTDLECPVCLKDFQDPKLLPCTHLVCRNCVLTWLSTPAAQGGCPLCRAPILSSPLPAGKSLDSCVDDLPTDLAVQSVIQIQEFLSSSHVCSLCDGGVAATSYCLQCTVKLCNSCIQKHMRIPCLQNHVVEDLKQLTAERLAETCRMPCKSHADRLVELYCSSHQELICMLCFPTNHRECGEVQAVSDVARQKRAELKDWADRLLGQEARMSTQIQASRNEYKQFQKKAEDAFDDLENILKQQRRTVMADIQTEVEARLTSLSRMEAHRTGLKARAGLVKKLASSASNDALLGMLGRLKRSEQTTTENMEAVAFTFRLEEVARLKEAILSLGGRKRLTGQATSGCSATTTTTTTTTTTPPAPCMASATLPTSRATFATTSLQPSTAAPAATATLPMSTTTAQVTATSAAATAATTRTSPAATSATAATTRPSPAATSATAATSAATLATTAPVPFTAKTTSTTTLTAKSTSPQSAPTVATMAKSPQSMVVAAAKSTSTTGEAKAASLQVTTAPAAKVTQTKTPAPKAILPLSTATSAAKATSTTLAAKAVPTTLETKATSTTLAAKAASTTFDAKATSTKLAAKAASTTTLMRRAVSTTSLAVKASSMTTLAAKATSTKVAAKPVPTTLAAKATTPATLAAKATSTTATLSAKPTTPTTLAAKTPLPQSTATPATLQAPTPSPAAKSTSTTTAAKAVLAKSTANSSAISPPSTATSAAILPQSTATSSATLPQSTATSSATLPQSTATSSAMLPSSTSTQAAAVTSPQTGSTSQPTGKEMIQMLKPGVRVIAGEGWMSKKEDGGGPGTVIEVVKHPISSAVFVKVQWDLTGILGVHRMTEQRGELDLL